MSRRECIGFEQITVSTTAIPLASVPKTASVALIKNSSANTARVRGDGTAPTASVGHLLAATGTYGDDVEMHGNLQNIKLIRAGGSDAILEVHYFATR